MQEPSKCIQKVAECSTVHSTPHHTALNMAITLSHHSLLSPYSGATADMLYITYGIVGASVLLTLLVSGAVSGAIFVALLKRRVQKKKKGKPPKRKGESPENSGATDRDGATGEQEDTNEYAHVVVNQKKSLEWSGALYQGLGGQEYVGEYAQLSRGTYQELDPGSKEVEHQYNKPSVGRKGCGKRM